MNDAHEEGCIPKALLQEILRKASVINEGREARIQLLESIIYELTERAGDSIELPFTILTRDRDPNCKTNGGVRIHINEPDNIITVDTITPAQADALQESHHAEHH